MGNKRKLFGLKSWGKKKTRIPSKMKMKIKIHSIFHKQKKKNFVPQIYFIFDIPGLIFVCFIFDNKINFKLIS